MDDPDGIQVAVDVERDADGGDGDALPPRGRVNNGVYLRRNADDQVLNDADDGQANVDPGEGDRPPLNGTLGRTIGRLSKRYGPNSTWTKTGMSFTIDCQHFLTTYGFCPFLIS